ncbi:MAG: hypothetical protein GKS06_20300 [Acidobacteria bacterium]|nr:hypothetical protein [Acidobacteriota bacterium]
MSNSKQKAAIVVLSDPNTGGEESLGRVFNALAVAYDYQSRGDDVQILFQGAGTRWPAELSKVDHPAHGLFKEVSESVAGASCGCADVFGAREGVETAGLELLTDNAAPGTTGLPSLGAMTEQGFQIYTF